MEIVFEEEPGMQLVVNLFDQLVDASSPSFVVTYHSAVLDHTIDAVLDLMPLYAGETSVLNAEEHRF